MKKQCLTPIVVAVAVALVAIFFAWRMVSDIGKREVSDIPKNVAVQAQLETDGTLSVVDQRTFTLQGEKTALSWEIEKTTSKSHTTITAVRLIVSGDAEPQIVPLEQAELGEEAQQELHEDHFEPLSENKWFFSVEDSWFYVSIPESFAGKEVVVEVSYVQQNAVYVYDDVAELYWTYLPKSAVSPATAMSDTTISATIIIPTVSANELVDHKTVWAWGHGEEGSVEFVAGGGYCFESTLSGSEKGSDAHIIFPASNLVNFDKNSATNVGGARQNRAISEESSWTDGYSIQACNTAVLGIYACAISACLTLVVTICYALIHRKYGRILGENVSYEEQLAFDARCQTFQKYALVLGIVCMCLALFCLFYMKLPIGFCAFCLSFVVCALETNWTPCIHSSFRDRIKR